MNPLLLVFILGIVFGSFCAFVAKEKNRDVAGWFVLGFFFSLIALLALVAVPKLDAKPSEQSKQEPEFIAGWECPKCETKNLPILDKCSNCGQNKPKPTILIGP